MSTPSTDPSTTTTTSTSSSGPDDDAAWLRDIARYPQLDEDEAARLRAIADRLASPVAPSGGSGDLMPGEGTVSDGTPCDSCGSREHLGIDCPTGARSSVGSRAVGSDEEVADVKAALAVAVGSLGDAYEERDHARDVAEMLEHEVARVRDDASGGAQWRTTLRATETQAKDAALAEVGYLLEGVAALLDKALADDPDWDEVTHGLRALLAPVEPTPGAVAATPESTRICDGCRVRTPWEHRCHGEPCGCPECREERRIFDGPVEPTPGATTGEGGRS